MDYAGTQDGYKYFRAAIPTNAAKFSVNNGKDKSGNYSKAATALEEILPLGTASTTGTGYTKNRMVFTLSGSTLNLESPTFTVTETAGTTSITEQDSRRDYTVRQSNSTNDVLYIRDVANWDIAFADGKIKFYDGNGQLITGDGTKGNGEYTLIKTVAETGADGKVWYYIEIPSNAESFNIFYYKNSTAYTSPNYDIYPYGAAGTEGNHTTTGNMYYETETDGRTLKLLDMTVDTKQVVTKAEYTAPSYVPDNTRDANGGDDLYLVCGDRTQWQDMKVTFYKGDGTPISGAEDVTPQYLNQVVYEPINPVSGESTSDENAVGYWYKVAIPKDAVSFTVTGTNTNNTAHTTANAVIYELRTTPTRFAENWTLGDMQYRLPDSGTTPTLLYPVFTEVDVQTMEAGGETVYDYVSSNKADETAVADYAGADAALLPTHNITEPAYPVLYETSDSKVTYEWTEGTSGDGKLRFDNSVLKWSTVTAKFYDNSDTLLGTVSVNDSTGSVVAFDVPVGATKVDFSKNGSTSSGEHSDIMDMSAQNNGRNQLFTPTYLSSNAFVFGFPDNSNWEGYYYFYGSSGAVGPSYPGTYFSSGYVSGVGSPSSKAYEVNIPSDATNVIFIYKNDQDGTHWYKTSSIPVSAIKGKGIYGTKNHSYASQDSLPQNGQESYVEFTFNNNYTPPIGGIDSGSFSNYISGTTSTTYTVTYQPEDRYGYINDVTGFDDRNNFIYITTSIDDPHIHFYSDDEGTTEIGTFTPSGTTDGISLAYTKVNDTEVAATSNPYKIRLPRNARSFKITGKSGSNTVTSAVQKLYENVTVSAETHQISGTGDQITLTNFHHAGTTFTYNGTNNAALTITSLRSGYTVSKGSMTDPLNPRTDADYIFFRSTREPMRTISSLPILKTSQTAAGSMLTTTAVWTASIQHGRALRQHKTAPHPRPTPTTTITRSICSVYRRVQTAHIPR